MLKDNSGNGIVFIKPWNNSKIIEKIRLSEEAGAFAVGVDLDACGLINNQFQENPFLLRQLMRLENWLNLLNYLYYKRNYDCR